MLFVVQRDSTTIVKISQLGEMLSGSNLEPRNLESLCH